MRLLTFLISCTTIFCFYCSFVVAQTPHELEVNQAEQLIDQKKIDQALEFYRDILKRYEQRPSREISGTELGKLNLRVAQVYLKQAQRESSPDMIFLYESYAFLHFLRCSQIKELDSFLRDDMCRRKVEEHMAPLQVQGRFKELFISHPEAFRGPTRPGALLPKGQVVLQITLETGTPRQEVITLPQSEPLVLQSNSSLTTQPPRLNQLNRAGLILRPTENSKLVLADTQEATTQSNSSRKTIRDIPSAPGYIMAGLGVATLIASGIIHFGFDEKDIQVGKERTVTWTLISGASLVAVGGGWIAFTW